MAIFNAKLYLTRSELEKDILKEVGGDIELNRAAWHEILGKFEELRKLQLSDSSTVFGIKCRYTVQPKKEERPKERPNRSESYLKNG